MRSWPCQLAVLGLLLMGFEGVTDLTMITDMHGDHAHGIAVAHHSPGHGDSGSDPDPEPEHHDHCGHSCHGHLTNVGAALELPLAARRRGPDAFLSPYVPTWSHAPPTPPPSV